MTRDQLIAKMEALLASADRENRDLNAEETAQWKEHQSQLDRIDRRAEVFARREQKPAPSGKQVPIQGGMSRLETLAIGPNESVADRLGFPAADTEELAHVVRAQLGAGGVKAAMNTYDGHAGGFLVSTSGAARLIDLARAKSRCIQAGVMTIPVMAATDHFVKLEKDPSFAQHIQNATIDEDEIQLGLHLVTPYTSAVLIRASIEAVEDAPNLGDVIADSLSSAHAVRMDGLILSGNGLGNVGGLLNNAAVTEIDGSGMTSWGPLARAYQAVRQNNFEPGAFVTSPGVIGQLDVALTDTTGQPLRRPPSLENTAILDTTNIPDEASPTGSVAVTGDWSKYFLCMRTDLTIEATRVGGDAFNKMSVLIRAYARFDGFAVRPKAFAKVVGIPTPAI